jgi:hypothetical protein
MLDAAYRAQELRRRRLQQVQRGSIRQHGVRQQTSA